MKRILWILLMSLSLSAGCSKGPEKEERAFLPSRKYHYTTQDAEALPVREMVYVPIYSDIYHMSGEQRFPLTATLSVRNISMKDSIFINRVDYYDSHGVLRRKYLQQTIFLNPLEAAEFVVEHKESEGGAGAAFVVEWRARVPAIRPIMQAIMIGTSFSQGISFETEGVVIETNLDSLRRQE